MPLSVGDRLGPYEILAPIGAGGMGEVYRARDPRLNRDVAIKRLKSSHTARFEQEARAIAALNHPHICQIYDVGPDYLVLEYIEGSPIQGPMTEPDAVRAAMQIAAALEAAHAKGILHRDLKPGNILMTAAGAKLLDFGLAKLVSDDQATLTIGVSGTPIYMSPEQAEGKVLDARSDVFSFGAVLYELLAGRRAFDSLAAVLRDEPRPLEASSGLQKIVGCCLRKSPADRFASAADVRAALEKISVRPAEQQPSIAVLPFANMSRDADDEFFSDGLAEEIINLLAHVPGLKVTARTSAFAFRGKEQDITKIAEVLRVKTVLEGSVRRAGNRIRVTAQLINAADGYHLWSERYDRELSDVFAIQDEIAAAITGALQLKLVAAPAHRHVPSLAAYEAYLKYRYYQWSFTPDASRRSRECLEQALALDPTFALPYVGLADYHLALASVGGMTAEESMPRARELAQRALELDPDLAEAHAMLGIVAGHYDFDWKECERRFDLAMAREPISAHLREWYANFFLEPLGRAGEALEHMRQVIELDPLCQMWHFVAATVLGALGRDAEAVAACERAVELDPQFWFGWWELGMRHATQGRPVPTLDCARKASAGAPWSPLSIGLLAGALEVAGETGEAKALLDRVQADPYRHPVARFCYHLVRRDKDSAVDALGRAVENRFTSIIVTSIRPFEPYLRQSSGWPALLKKMNLTEAS
jgi:eukaryotic-like serine/threonine-protein kinase